MTVARGISTKAVAEVFSGAVRGVASARDAWASVQDGTYDLWLLIEPMDMVEERDLYLLEDALYEHFPSVGFFLHVLNPQMFVDLRPETIVPSHAQHIRIRAPA